MTSPQMAAEWLQLRFRVLYLLDWTFYSAYFWSGLLGLMALWSGVPLWGFEATLALDGCGDTRGFFPLLGERMLGLNWAQWEELTAHIRLESFSLWHDVSISHISGHTLDLFIHYVTTRNVLFSVVWLSAEAGFMRPTGHRFMGLRS